MRHAGAVVVDTDAPGRAEPMAGGGSGRRLRDPTRFLAAARCDLGDPFSVDAFGVRLFCVFSPAGVRRLYALAEHDVTIPSLRVTRCIASEVFESSLRRYLDQHLEAARIGVDLRKHQTAARSPMSRCC
jgi:hypothetical protein